MREKIIDAAIAEFTQSGLKFTMSDLAKDLGISKKTIYTVFESSKLFSLPLQTAILLILLKCKRNWNKIQV